MSTTTDSGMPEDVWQGNSWDSVPGDVAELRKLFNLYFGECCNLRSYHREEERATVKLCVKLGMSDTEHWECFIQFTVIWAERNV